MLIGYFTKYYFAVFLSKTGETGDIYYIKHTPRGPLGPQLELNSFYIFFGKKKMR